MLVRGAWIAMLVWTVAGAAAGQSASPPMQLADRGPTFFAIPTPGAAPVDARDASAMRRRVSLELIDVPLGVALRVITQQSGVRFVYKPEFVPEDMRVTLEAQNIRVSAALTELLSDARLDVELTGPSEATLIRRVGPALGGGRNQAGGTIQGRVIDAETRLSLDQVAVRVEGLALSGITTSDGRYTIRNVPAGTYRVSARRLGYTPLTKSATAVPDQATVADFALVRSPSQLDQVVVTGTIAPTAQRELPNPITVIGAEEIQQKGITSLTQLFQGEVPGVVAYDPGNFSDQFGAEITVRGASTLDDLNPRTIKTYIDGVEVSDPTWLLYIDPKMIERIEIVRGPQASTLYGAAAISGVMQVFTKKGSAWPHPRVSATLSSGMIEHRFSGSPAPQADLGVSVEGGSEAFSYNAGGSYVYIGNWGPDYGSYNWSGFASVRRTEGRITVAATVRVNDHESAVPANRVWANYVESGIWHNGPAGIAGAGLIPGHERVSAPQQTIGATITYATTDNWSQTLAVGRDQGTSPNIVQTAPKYTTPADSLLFVAPNDQARTSIGYNTTLRLPVGRSVSTSWTAGIDYWQLSGTSAFAFGTPSTVGNLSPQFSSLSRTDDHDAGYFLQSTMGVLDAVFVTAGLRAESNPNFGSAHGLDYSPRVGLSYAREMGPLSIKIRTAYGRAIRPPVAGDKQAAIFDPLSRQAANPRLGPEVQVGGDGGIDVYYRDVASLETTYYSQRADDLLQSALLAFDPSTGASIYQNQNVGRVKNTGVELHGSLRPIAPLRLTATYSVTASRVERLAPGYVGSFTHTYHVGEDVLGVAHSAGALGVQVLEGPTTVTVDASLIGRSRNVDWLSYFTQSVGRLNPNPAATPQAIMYPVLAKYDVSVAHELTNHLAAFVRVRNLTNNVTPDFRNHYEMMGRSTMAGVRLQ